MLFSQNKIQQIFTKLDKNKLLFKVISYFVLLLNPLLSIIEKLIITKYKKESEGFPIYIIGAPRSGSTILYQIITNLFNVNYIDNLMCLLKKTPYLGHLVSNFIFRGSPHNSYTSKYGDTYKDGFHAPSECGAFWYTWLIQKRHFIDGSEIEDNVRNKLKDIINSFITSDDKPFVFKNLSSGQRIKLLKDITPNAKYIFIQRNPVDTIKSIYKVRQRLKINPKEWWSIKPKNYESLLKLDEIDMITHQVYFLEKQILDDLKMIPNENIIRVRYESIFNNFAFFIKNIQIFIGKDVSYKKGYNKPINLKNEKQNSSELEIQIRSAMRQLNWNILYE